MTPITLPAGVVHTASKANKSTNWREVNLIRWTGDTVRPIKGWEDTGIGPFASRVRKIFKWADNALNEYVAYLCETNLYVQVSDELRDITPVGADTAVNGTFAADASWAKGTNVTISGGLAHTAATPNGHGLSQAQVLAAGITYKVIFTVSSYSAGGIHPFFSGGTGVLGASVAANGTYVQYITALTGNNTFGLAVDGVTTLNIDNVSIQPQNLLGPGTGAAGFGEGLFSAGLFGTPREGESRFNNPSPIYTLDNWGEELRAMTSPDGRLLRWSPSMGITESAVAVTGAPTNNRTFIVTPERYIILFGLGGERDKYGWCDQEDDTNWNFADPLSDAGFYNIEPKSAIAAVCEALNGIFMQSLNQSFFINYVGQPSIYSHVSVGALAVPISAASIVETPEGVMWQAIDNFWVYNGVSIAPVQCEITDWIEDQIDINKSLVRANAVNVYTKTEVWYFFTSTAATTEYNDRLAIYNYKTRTWSMGTVGRTCGFNYANDANPLMSDGSIVYKHETGNAYANYNDKPWLETHTVNIDEGTEFITIQSLFPEITGDPTGIRFSLNRNTVRQPNKYSYTPQKSIRDNGYVDIRETARDVRIRIDADFADGWELGIIGVNAVGRGKKT